MKRALPREWRGWGSSALTCRSAGAFRQSRTQESGSRVHGQSGVSVTTAQGTKVVIWEDAVSNDDEQAADLRSLARLIKRMIYARPEFKALPEPEGGYL